MIYRQIENKNELFSFCEFVKENWSLDYSFLLKDDIIVKGYFDDDEAEEPSSASIFFVFAKIIRPYEISVPKGTIFEKIKLYGSSGKYIGLLSGTGDIVIPNCYTSIEYLGNALFRVGRDNKYGIINSEGKVLCGTIYDKILDMSEFTIGIVKDKHMGYMDCFGHIVIPMNYVYLKKNENMFHDGKVKVRNYIEEEGIIQDFEIDHYNNIVSSIHEWNINEDDYDPFPSRPPIVDYDILDAYEGDEANRWNTD